MAKLAGPDWNSRNRCLMNFLIQCDRKYVIQKKVRWDSGKPRLATNSLRWYTDEGGNKLLANICIQYRSPTTQNVSDLDFDRKGKCDGVIGLPIYGFLLTFNSNIGPNFAPLRDIRLWNPSDLTLTFQGHSRSNVIVGLPIHGFLLMVNSNLGPNSSPLRDIRF